MVYLLPPNGRPDGKILPADNMCKTSQQTPVQAPDYPRLQATAGAMIALRYRENGHTTLLTPLNKPDNRGTVYIYGTTEPKQDESFLAIHKVWNTDGTGGDKRGKLLAKQDFDDDQCYQQNPSEISTVRQKNFPVTPEEFEGTDLLCQNDISLPQDAPVGKPYTLYWVWDWPTFENTPKQMEELYTSCMDVDIIAGDLGTNKKVAPPADIKDLSLNSVAAARYLADVTNGPTLAAASGSASPSAATTQAMPVPTSATSVTASIPASLTSNMVGVPVMTVVPMTTLMTTVTMPAGAVASAITNIPASLPTTTVTMQQQPTSQSSAGASSFSNCTSSKTQDGSITLLCTGDVGKRDSEHLALHKKSFRRPGSAKFRKI